VGIRKIYGKKSVRITNSRFVFSDTPRLGQAAGKKDSVSGAVNLYSCGMGARIRTFFFAIYFMDPCYWVLLACHEHGTVPIIVWTYNSRIRRILLPLLTTSW